MKMTLKTQTSAIGSAPSPSPDRTWSNELRRGRVPGPRLPQQRVVPADGGIGTMCVHAGTYEDPTTGAVTGTVFQTTTFRFSETSYASFSQGITRDVPIYTRYGNPSQWSVQEKIATLEGAESACVFASGMAAIFTTLLALTNRGGHIVGAYDVYGGTYDLLKELHQLGRSVTFVDPTNLNDIEAAIRDETQILFFETLTNPLLKAIPLEGIAELARRKKLLLIVDNTFLTPVFCRPILNGAHLVIHSCTKYLNGHSDLVAGAVSGSRKYVDRVWQQSLRVGGQLEPIACFLLERGLKTLEVRMRRQADNATQVAAHLEKHPRVAAVHYPSLESYPYRWVDTYCRGGYGGLVAFEVRGGDEAALQMTDRLQIPALATSLGGVESLVSLPFNTSHSTLTGKQRSQMGIRPGLVRLSVGIEDIQDLLRDLDQALNVEEAKP
jgi:cystathionine beta-lyase/cystathionine gamma-synthase